MFICFIYFIRRLILAYFDKLNEINLFPDSIYIRAVQLIKKKSGEEGGMAGKANLLVLKYIGE